MTDRQRISARGRPDRAPYRTVAFVVPDDVIDIGYFATTSTYINERPIIGWMAIRQWRCR